MTLFHFRLTDESQEWLSSAVTYFRANSVVYMAVYETSRLGKLHIHCILDFNNKSTFIQQFHKYFNKRWVGNGSYSCESLKKGLENNLIYLSKGSRFKHPDVIFLKDDISMETVVSYWVKYWEDKPIEKDMTLVSKNKEKLSKLTWSEMVTLEIKTSYPDRDWKYDAIDINVLMDIVLKKLGSQSKKLNSFIIRDLVLGQLNALNSHCNGLKSVIRNIAFPDLFGNQ